MNTVRTNRAIAACAEPAPLSIAIVDPSPLVRECLAQAIDEAGRMHVTYEAAGLRELRMRPPAGSPDVFLVAARPADPETLELLRYLGREFPGARLLARATDEGVGAMVGNCVAGARVTVLSPRHRLADLKEGLAALLQGEALYLPAAPPAPIRLAAVPAAAVAPPVELTSREIEILKLVAVGLANKEIAKKLIISLHTVKNHVHNILEKLGLSGRYAAVAYACQRGWLQQPWG